MENKSALFRITYNFPSVAQLYTARLGDLAKRGIDVIFSLFGLIILSPIFGVIALVIKLDSPGPVFFHGLRTGRDGKTFFIHKFRTMYERPESYQGPKVTAQNDQRITRLGRWLRNTKINELPQLWNVLKGDMSLVGPRPGIPDIVATWDEDTRREILSARPGITSPASVIYRHEEKMLNAKHDVMRTYMKSIMPSKIRLDQLYVRNRSFWLDLDVLIWTLLVLLPNLGSYQPPENYLFWGPIYRLFRRYISWFLLDTLITFAAFATAGLFWGASGPLNIGKLTAVVISLGFALLFSMTGAIMGVNRIAWSKASLVDIFDLIPALFIATSIVIVINDLLGVFPAGLILLSSMFAFVGFIVVRYRMRLITGLVSRILVMRPGGLSAREKVLIVGSGQAGQFAAGMLSYRQGYGAYHVIGFIDDDYYRKGERIQGTNVIGSRDDIPRLVKRYDIGVIIFAIHNIDPEERQKMLEICHQTQASVYLLPDFLGALENITLLSRNHNAIYKGINNVAEDDSQPGLSQDDINTVPSEDIYDRHHFMELAKQEFIRSLQTNSSLKAIMFEIDQLESINDKNGHTLGDQLLGMVASHCKKKLRNVDLLGLYEGGKFVVLIPDTNMSSVRIVAIRLLNYIADTPFETDYGTFRVKLNLGIAERNDDTTTLITLLNRALADLIVFKQSGGALVDGADNKELRNEILGGELLI